MFSDKFKYIFFAVTYFVGAMLIGISAAFTEGIDSGMLLVAFLPSGIIGSCSAILCFLNIKYKKGAVEFINILFAMGFIAMGAMTLVLTEFSTLGILIFSGCLAGAINFIYNFGYYFVLTVLHMGNFGYHGMPPMPYWRKLCEVLLQIALLPISAFVNVCWAYFWMGGAHLSGLINQRFFLCLLKGNAVEHGYSYNVGESDTLVETKTHHEISDGAGHFIGDYETTEYELVHDDGNRYDYSGQFIFALWTGLIALPKRVICLLLSIIALFVPKMYVSAIRLYTPYDYYEWLFSWFDIIIFKKKKTNDNTM